MRQNHCRWITLQHQYTRSRAFHRLGLFGQLRQQRLGIGAGFGRHHRLHGAEMHKLGGAHHAHQPHIGTHMRRTQHGKAHRHPAFRAVVDHDEIGGGSIHQRSVRRFGALEQVKPGS